MGKYCKYFTTETIPLLLLRKDTRYKYLKTMKIEVKNLHTKSVTSFLFMYQKLFMLTMTMDVVVLFVVKCC